jgi:hypothetical protein
MPSASSEERRVFKLESPMNSIQDVKERMDADRVCGLTDFERLKDEVSRMHEELQNLARNAKSKRAMERRYSYLSSKSSELFDSLWNGSLSERVVLEFLDDLQRIEEKKMSHEGLRGKYFERYYRPDVPSA